MKTNTLIAMLTEDKIKEIFVMADEFCKVFNAMLRHRGLSETSKGKKRKSHREHSRVWLKYGVSFYSEL
jgi:hypothetical protein|nr:hypothetical protein [uncultured Duncaniella sp.]